MDAEHADRKPNGEPEFDRFADDYDVELNKGLSFTGESKDYFARERARWLRGQIRELDFVPSRALDFGCGTGSATPFLLDIVGVDSLIGVDPSSHSLGVAQKAFEGRSVTFVTAEDFGDRAPVDLAFCNGVFHHMPVAERAASAHFVFESLRPGGLFAFWENNAWNPGTRYVMSKVPFDKDAILVYPHGARKLLRASGFEIISTDYLFVFPRPLSLLRPAERWMRKLPLGGQYVVLARRPG